MNMKFRVSKWILASIHHSLSLKILSFKIIIIEKFEKMFIIVKLSALKNEKKGEIISGTFCKMCLNWLILKFFLGTIIFLNNCKTHLMMFLKGNLRPILWSLGSLWGTQISQNKLRSALFQRTNEKNTLYIH